MKVFQASSEEEKNILMLEYLQERVSIELNDFFEYTISPAILDHNAAPYGGARFPVIAFLDGRSFSQFHLDVGIGDVWIDPHDEVELKDWLSFANIKTIKIPLISQEQHFAEQVQAYTLPRDHMFNSRAKDLVDLVLLINKKELKKELLQKAIQETFKRRTTHDIPTELPEPPIEWEKPFNVLADECGLNIELGEGFKLVARYYRNHCIFGIN